MTFKDLKIDEKIIDLLSKKNITNPTQIQKECIPQILNNYDVLAKAPTGTGKTATYVIPIIQKLKNEPINFYPKVLVLSPTRELAKQILETFNIFKKEFNLRVIPLIGGESISKQIKQIEIGVDIIVGTPGRIIDLLKQKKLSLEHIKYFVLDEVDLLLDMGFQKDIKNIHFYLSKKIQTIFLSATIDKQIKKMIDLFLKSNFKYIEAKLENGKEKNIQQNLIFLERKNKPSYLIELILSNPNKTFIIFINTKKVSNYLSRVLHESKIKSSVIHGDKSQIFREKALNSFKNKNTKVLIATDVASRGIHIDNVNFVINYDIPNNKYTYIHRIGRTGRANSKGVSYSLATIDDLFYLKQINTSLMNIIHDHPFSKVISINEIINSKPIEINKKKKNKDSRKKEYKNDKKYESKRDQKRKKNINEFNERFELKKNLNNFKWGYKEANKIKQCKKNNKSYKVSKEGKYGNRKSKNGRRERNYKNL